MQTTKKKEFTYRGKTTEELKSLGVREFAKLLPSRGKRTVLRNFQEHEDFVSNSKKKIEKGKAVRTHKRDLLVVPEMIGMKIGIHNGKNFLIVEIVGDMLGHKLGEFAVTRSRVAHSKAGIGATKGSKHKAKK